MRKAPRLTNDIVEQRRAKRFTLVLPVAVTRTGAERVSRLGRTKNISSNGVLFTLSQAPDVGGPIEYVITLTSPPEPPVNLRCMGKVLRSERLANGEDPSYEIAATLERYEFVRS